MEGYHLIAEEAARLASRLPASVIETVVARLERSDGSDWANLRGQIALAIPTPDYRGAVISLLDRWRSNWDKAESLVRQALDELVSFASAGGWFQRRLFVEDAKQGLGFVDVCRQRFHVVLMNPPFGESSKPARGLLEKQYPRTKNDLYAAFVEMGLRRLHLGGLLGRSRPGPASSCRRSRSGGRKSSCERPSRPCSPTWVTGCLIQRWSRLRRIVW